MTYPNSNNAGPFIIQCCHEWKWIDLLEIKRGGVDPQGYGVLTLQNNESDMHITMYLGEQYNEEEDYHNSKLEDEYTLCCNVSYNRNLVMKNNKDFNLSRVKELQINTWQR